MPHACTLECFANIVLINLIKNSVWLWKTTLNNSKTITQVTIKCGIYQGDALSLLLFCIGQESPWTQNQNQKKVKDTLIGHWAPTGLCIATDLVQQRCGNQVGWRIVSLLLVDGVILLPSKGCKLQKTDKNKDCLQVSVTR